VPRSLPTFAVFVLTFCIALPGLAQAPPEQLQVVPPVRRIGPPPSGWSVSQLEIQGDELRTDKAYLDALDYYQAALSKQPTSILHNKIGITYLQLQHFDRASKSFQKSIKLDKGYADAHNNLGVIYYLQKKYGKAIKEYGKALKLAENTASFHSNLGTAYFSKKQFEKATIEYTRALQLDPDIFERTSHSGVAAQMSSPEDRAHYDYVVAKMYARLGISERSLLYLRKAIEEGYKDIGRVYKDNEFAGLRKDPRFAELMASRPPGIAE
jgi:tetratricopeptide (TPR) repeat protein